MSALREFRWMLEEWLADAGFVAFLLLLPGAVFMAWREWVREKRRRRRENQKALHQSFKRAKALDSSSSHHRR